MPISGIPNRKRRSAFLWATVFFVASGIAFAIPYRNVNGPFAAFAEGVFGNPPEACMENGIGWCETPEAYRVLYDLEIPSESRFFLDRPIIVENGARLTVGEGTRFIFSQGDADEYPLGLVAVDGNVSARGTAEYPIVFAKADPETEFTIYFFGGSAEFDHVRIEGGGEGKASSGFQAWLRSRSRVVFADTFFDVVPAVRYEGGAVTIRNAVFSGSGGADIFLPGADQRTFETYPSDSSLLVESSDFGCDTDIPAVLNGNGPAFGDPSYPSSVTLRENWYGSADGPRVFEYYDERSGKEIIGPVRFEGFVTEPYVERCASNVLFLPGIKASRLYMREDDGGEDQLWPPTSFSDDISELALDDEGNSLNAVYTRDVLESAGFSNFYASFIDDLKQAKEEYIIRDFLPFAYDWRMSVHDVAYGYTPYPDDDKSLFYETRDLAESSKSGKVTIIAHSNGGLVAKELLMRLEERGMTDIIDRVIFVGTPQMGTPKSILSLLYGYEEELVGGLLASRENVRELAENMPGAYGLLPSSEYFNRTEEEPIVSFSEESEHTRVKSYRDAYGETIGDRSEFESFLSGEGDGREKPAKERTDLENVLRRNLLDLSRNVQDELTTWTPPSDVEVIQIAGWGLDTISGIRYAEKEKDVCLQTTGKVPYCHGDGEYEAFYEPVFTVDGDAIVTAPSALMLSTAENVKKYWVDLWRSMDSSRQEQKHADILENAYVRSILAKLISCAENDSSLPEYISASRPPDYENAKPRIRMSLYSPLDVSLIDAHGNRTGTVRIEENGEEHIASEEHIPGSSFLNLDERKYVSFPAGEPVDIRLDGYADGAYTLKLEEIRLTESGEEVVSHTTFEHLPTTADTTVELSIPESGLGDISTLLADIDSDGSTDYAVEPVMNGTATLAPVESDTTPPETESTLSDPEGENGWYLGDMTVTLSAMDDGSGIASTEYSLDDGTTWEIYIEPFVISEEGVYTIFYRSTDQAGNIGKTKREEVKIDRTAPTARIGLDPDTRRITVSGSDELSEVTIERREEDISPKRRDWGGFFSWIPAQGRNDKTRVRMNVTLSDEAGHVTDIAFTEERKYGTSFTLSDFSISQDGRNLDTSKMYASYDTIPGRWGCDYASLVSSLRTGSEAALSWYDGWRDMTWVTSFFPGEGVRREWKDGIVVPMLEVRENEIRIILK